MKTYPWVTGLECGIPRKSFKCVAFEATFAGYAIMHQHLISCRCFGGEQLLKFGENLFMGLPSVEHPQALILPPHHNKHLDSAGYYYNPNNLGHTET